MRARGTSRASNGSGFAGWLYRFLLLAYPAEFRRAYGRDATELFRDLHGDAHATGGLAAVLRLWKSSATQVLAFGIRERWESVGSPGRRLLRGRATGGRAPKRRDRRGSPAGSTERLVQDIRYAARSLSKRPGFALLTMLIVALGIGATTTIFSVVDAVLLRPLPYPDADRLLVFAKDNSSVPVPDYVDWRDRTRSFEAWAGTWVVSRDLTGVGEPERLSAAQVTPKLLSIFGARSGRGRLLTAGDYAEGAPRVAVLSYEFWARRWGADPGVVGQTITLGGEPTVVVGAVERGFTPPEGMGRLAGADVYVPFDLARPELQNRRLFIMSVVAKLGPDVSYEMARAELDVLQTALQAEYPDSYIDPDGSRVEINSATLESATLGNIGRTLYMLLGAVALMLLIACANVANLFLARGTDREREMALRSALGANRGRIVGQLLTESVLLAVVGGALGVGVAFAGVKAFNVLNPGGIPRLSEVAVDLRVLAFAFGLAVATGLAFGIVPALSSAWSDTYAALREGTSHTTAGRGRSRLRNALVVAETGLALVLLVGAGLLFNSFVRLRQVETGFRSEGLTTLQLNLGTAYEDEARVRFAQELLERLAAAPGVVAAGASWRLPFDRGRCCWRTRLWPTASTDTASSYIHPVTPDYFRALGATLRRGRGFTQADAAIEPISIMGAPEDRIAPEQPIPLILNRRLAERWWPEGDAIGQPLATSSLPGADLRVVGVVEDIRHWRLQADITQSIYVPFAPFAGPVELLDVAVRHEGGMAGIADLIRRAVWEINPNLPLGAIASMESRISRSVATPRFYASLLTTFAVVAFVLAAGGIYGSMLYSVGQRQRELGIRIALGAERRDVLRMIVGRGMLLTAIGIGLGLAGAYALSRTLESLVFGITATDPATFVIVSVLLAAVALLACFLPAARAARTDPIETLRAE